MFFFSEDFPESSLEEFAEENASQYGSQEDEDFLKEDVKNLVDSLFKFDRNAPRKVEVFYPQSSSKELDIYADYWGTKEFLMGLQKQDEKLVAKRKEVVCKCGWVKTSGQIF